MERGGGGEREEIKELPFFHHPKLNNLFTSKLGIQYTEATVQGLKEASTHAIQALKDGPSDETVVSKFIL